MKVLRCKKILLGLALFALSNCSIVNVWASPTSKDNYLKDTKDNYLPAAQAVANSLKSEVDTKISTIWDGKDPEFYGGNDVAGIAAAFVSDTQKIITEDFLGCLDFQIVGICKKHGVPTGFKIEYRWPMEVVHQHGFFQNRYFPKEFYTALKATNYMEEMFYPLVNQVITPFTIGFGGYRAWQEGLFHGNNFGTSPVVEAGNFDLSKSDKRQRYASGSIGTAGHFEYSVIPTTAQLLWSVLSDVFPILQYIPCTPPTQIPVPLTSEDPLSIELTRNWALYPLLYKDADLPGDMNLWINDPSACVRYNMTEGNIPEDMYQPSIDTIPSGPALYTPMQQSEVGKYKRMCTKNWGSVLPITTTESVNPHDIVNAGISFQKALRYAWGIYLTFIRENDFPRDSDGYKLSEPNNWKNQGGAAQYVAYYGFDKDKDRIQYVYHNETPKKCMKVGSPAPKFQNADQMRSPDEAGLYSIVHWKHFRCCADFF